jgi:hypothetical protein
MDKKSTPVENDDPLDREVDFSDAKPNPFAPDYGCNRNLRILAPDLLAVFPNSDSVDEALRAFIRLTTTSPQKNNERTISAFKTRKSR